MSILVFGHKNPDTDTICSAIAYAELKGKLGKDVKAVRLGEVNEETKFVLNYFKVEKPELIESVSGKEIMLVDHNERTQTADGFEEAKVLELVDHHRISNFNVDEPLYVRMEPVGCTATIILKLFKENNLLPAPTTAGLMLSAIISDTLLFKSPTCTECDVKAGKELAEIAGVNVEEYGLEMLKINNIIKKEGLKFFIFAITNILSNDSTGIVAGDGNAIIEKAFNEKIDNNLIALKGIVSRKKQIIPPLTKAIQEA